MNRYRKIFGMQSHPRATKSGKYGAFVYEHVLIAEKAIGRLLESSHPVHHHNEIRSDNRNQNLVICEDQGYHMLLHVRAKVVARGGDPNTHKICFQCDSIKAKEEFPQLLSSPDGRFRKCKACHNGDRQTRRWLAPRLRPYRAIMTRETESAILERSLSGLTQAAIATEFGVTRPAISYALKRCKARLEAVWP